MARPVLQYFSTFLRWTLWLALAASLAFQLRILADGGLRLPPFAASLLSAQLAKQGLAFQSEAVWLDPRGRLLLLAPRLSLAGQDSPFASARAVSLQLRRRALLQGELRATRIELIDLNLSLPAIASPTGAPQPLLTAGEFRLSSPPDSPAWQVDQASARLLGVATAFTGYLPPLPERDPAAPPAPPAASIRLALGQAAALYRELAALPLDSLRIVRVDLAPARLVVSAEVPALTLPAHPALPPPLVGSTLEEIAVRLILPFAGHTARPELHLRAARLATPPALALAGENLALRLSPGPVLSADLAFSSIQKTDTPVPPAPLLLAVRHAASSGALSVDASARLADSPWHATLEGSASDLAGRATATGALTPALLDLARAWLPPAARPILTLVDPISVDLAADFAPGARPVLLTARLAAGRAVAHHVEFAAAAATLRYDISGHRLLAEDLLLVQDASRATGSYEMDTKSLAYRFLLGGHLRPMAIEGWFGPWWDGFWAAFGFGPLPPSAEVDIQGVWGDPPRTTLFVAAASGPLRLRDLPLDSLATRLWIRTHFIDAVGFRATSGPRLATGSFSRLLGPDRSALARLAFDVRADFPAESLPLLFGETGAAIVAPFALSAPPFVHLVGETFGPASGPRAGHQAYTLELSTPAPLRYQGFPLDHLSLRLERNGPDLLFHELRAGFASGLATGEARLSGPDADRWLAFDVALADADLDLALARWKDFQATRPSPAASSASPPPAAPPAKLPGGRVTLRLAATGPFADPLAYSGRGEATIRGADLANIRLLGRLSTLLGDLGLGFSTLKLNEADARFSLEKNRLAFDSLALSGPSALVESRGTYALPDGTLDFTAKIRPFENSGGLLSSTVGFVFSPLTHALEVELRGTLDQPVWTFSYGPTRLFRRITDRF